VTRRFATLLIPTAVIVSALGSAAYAGQGAGEPANQRPTVTFRAGVEVVSITAAVRDGRGRIVRNLKRSDFEIVDSGTSREIREFYTGEAPVSLAVLLDISGSMAVSGNIDRARHAVSVAMGLLAAGRDEAALYTFDAELQEVVPFTRDVDRVRRVKLEGRPWGITSLYDAVGTAARTVAARANRHRALLVITDGVDTGSTLTAPEVSGIASSIDVPVYLLTVVSPLDHPGGELSVVGPYARVPRGVRRQGPFRALRVKGPLAFSEVGIVASLTALLAEARIPIFVLSTYKTDYLLVPQRHLHPALRALRIAGHRIRRPR